MALLAGRSYAKDITVLCCSSLTVPWNLWLLSMHDFVLTDEGNMVSG